MDDVGRTFGFRDEEEHKRNGEEHHRGEEEVDATSRIAHVEEHLRREARDDEVPEPVVHGRRRLTERAHALVEHLAVEDPRGAVPRGRVEGGPKIKEEDARDTARGERLRLGAVRRFDADGGQVAADDPHADGAAGAADEEKVAAAQAVDEQEEPDEGETGLDDAEEAGGQEGGVGATDAERGKDGGRVVVDGVDAAAVLEEEEHASEEEAGKSISWMSGEEGME